MYFLPLRVGSARTVRTRPVVHTLISSPRIYCALKEGQRPLDPLRIEWPVAIAAAVQGANCE